MRKINIQRLDPYWQDDSKFKCDATNCKRGSEFRIEDNLYCSICGLEVIALLSSQQEDDE